MNKTKIQWTDTSWNPVRGCSVISAGCENCYAMNVAARFSGEGQPYEGLARFSKERRLPQWTGKVRLVPEHLGDPLRWTKPRRVFVNSMSDLFHDELSNEQIASVFGVMAAASTHTFQVLTKRAIRMRDWFRWVDTRPSEPGCGNGFRHPFQVLVDSLGRGDVTVQSLYEARGGGAAPWPLPNVHLGVSVEDQRAADERIPLLLETPAAVRFISAEPLLDRIQIARYMWPTCWAWDARYRTPEEALAAGAMARRHPQALVLAPARFLDWVIVGGESGPRARPFDAAWAREIVGDCKAAGVPVFVKQLGSNAVGVPKHLLPLNRKGDDPAQWPVELREREFPIVGSKQKGQS